MTRIDLENINYLAPTCLADVRAFPILILAQQCASYGAEDSSKSECTNCQGCEDGYQPMILHNDHRGKFITSIKASLPTEADGKISGVA